MSVAICFDLSVNMAVNQSVSFVVTTPLLLWETIFFYTQNLLLYRKCFFSSIDLLLGRPS